MNYYCLSCRPKAEASVIKMMKKIVTYEFEDAKEITCYFPVREQVIKRNKQLIQEKSPVLPGYIIIKTEYNLGEIHNKIRTMTSSSYGLLRNSDKSFELRDKDKSFAIWIEQLGGLISPSKVKILNNIKKGSNVVVLSGPLKSLKGEIIRLYKDTRALVEIEFLGEVRRINLPIEIINNLD